MKSAIVNERRQENGMMRGSSDQSGRKWNDYDEEEEEKKKKKLMNM